MSDEDVQTAVMDALQHAIHAMHGDNWRAKADALIAGLASRGYVVVRIPVAPTPVQLDRFPTEDEWRGWPSFTFARGDRSLVCYRDDVEQRTVTVDMFGMAWLRLASQPMTPICLGDGFGARP